MRLHIGKAFNSLKLTDYLEEKEMSFNTNKTACVVAIRLIEAEPTPVMTN